MPTDKEIKKQFKIKASKEPDKYYATTVLRAEGFKRKRCKCGTYFWTATDSNVCGDPACSGGFRFIGKTAAKKELSYIEVWKEFSRLFKKRGYTPINRYPVVARWRDDTDFVQASIYDFQPYVVSGAVEPPANPLVVPQFSLRFNDIDNVGITGAHYTGFVMIGQHAFMKPKDWDQKKYFTDIHNWLKEGLGLKNEEITFHEDAWAGGGNFGPCMEYFSQGLELGNQVYMLYEQTPSGFKELDIKVLDMGMGHERIAWFTKGAPTSYETTFPTVCKKLYHATGLNPDNTLIKKFLPYASYLNIDEIKDIDKVWKQVAEKIKFNVKGLKSKILPLAALYSIAEHSRSLLVALSDGALPSNIGGGYNLRVILRRALSFIDKYGWNLNLPDICKWHANYLKPLFPELSKNLGEINAILEIEKSKYEQTKQKSRQIITRLVKEKIDEKLLLQLYDSQGITPALIKEEAEKLNKKINIPENFYAKVSALHEKVVQKHATEKEDKLDLSNIPETKALYFDDYKKIKFKAKVVKVIDNKIILDQTAFYPTSGGQLYDTGTIANEPVIDVFKQGNVIVHVLTAPHKFPIGEEVECVINLERRKQLSQHHTATHIVNAAARKVLGSHINQAGAKKTEEKAHLDVTHYKNISDEELKKIEEEANKTVKMSLPIKKTFLLRNEAEKKYGMKIYQGGAVAGKTLRIVEIPKVDVECCAGTHLNNTKEVEEIKILKSTKISDGVVRIEFKAGKTIESEKENIKDIISKVSESLILFNETLKKSIEPIMVNMLIIKESFKRSIEPMIKAQESVRKSMEPIIEMSTKMSETLRNIREPLKKWEKEMKKLAQEFSVKVDQLPKTLNRFIDEYNQHVKVITKLEKEISQLENRKPNLKDIEKINFKCDRIVIGKIPEFGKWLFETWKKQNKEIGKLNKKLVELKRDKIKDSSVEIVDLDVPAMQNIARKLKEVLLVNKEGLFVFKGDDKIFKKLISIGAKGGGKEIKKGKIDPNKVKKLKNIFI